MTQDKRIGFTVKQAGMLSLILDSGRFGQHKLGLTEGGPADKLAFDWCHRLLSNHSHSTAIEVSIGGLVLESHCYAIGCITGAKMPVTISGRAVSLWQTFIIEPGDLIEFGYAEFGVRSYFSIAGGFDIEPQFGSCSTVVREKIGGINGKPLAAKDKLPIPHAHSGLDALSSSTETELKKLDIEFQPEYVDQVKLRVVMGYQQDWFSASQIRLFLTSTYKVSSQWDRMGYRLSGAPVVANQSAMYSEGIALGSVQIPADGQPIVLLHDRQTIGGYPKIGTVLSLDLAKLTQCKQGAEVSFEAISIEQAHNLLHLAQYQYRHTPITTFQ